MARSTAKLTLFAAFLFLSFVKADWPGRRDWEDGEYEGNDDDGKNTASTINGFRLGSVEEFNRASKTLIAHATIASLVWLLFIPSGAILLRLGLNNPMILKLHAVLQTLSWFLYIVAAGMGIWLAQQAARFGTWEDPHPSLGLAILAIAFFQPIFGAIHRRKFKKRSADVSASKSTKSPGRTIVGRIHLWVGRALIVLGMINGGLGIRLASSSPFQTDETTRRAKIAYSVVVTAMVALYTTLVIAFEVRRKRAQSKMTVQGVRRTAHGENAAKLPIYDESQSEESLQRNPTSRYQKDGQIGLRRFLLEG